MNNYEVKEGQQKEKVLFINGNQSVCPFVDPIPMQGQMGQIQIMRLPCNTLCPLCELKGNQWVINCGYDKVTHEVTEEKKLSSDVLTIIQ